MPTTMSIPNLIFVWLFGFWSLASLQSWAAVDAPTVAVAYFDNTSGQKDFDHLSKGLADMLITDLTKMSSLKVVEREKLELLLKEIKLNKSAFVDQKSAQQLGKGLGAKYLLTGGFFLMGKDMRIDARLLNVESGEIIMAESVQGLRNDFFAMEKKLAEKIVGNLKVKPRREETYALLVPETKSFEAFEKYSAGLDSIDKKNYAAAQQYLKHAIQLDSGYDKARDALELAIKALQKDVAEVKVQTKRLDESVKGIESRTETIETTLSEISRGFASIAKAGTLITMPQKPEQFYFNALLYQDRGDSGNARLNYMFYMGSKKEYVDPVDRFVRMLVTMDGRTGAAEIMRGIRADYPSPALDLYLQTIKEPRLAADGLASIANSNPNYGPVYYLLAEQFSSTRLGEQSMDDKRKERGYLKSFIEAHKKGNVLPYFIDVRMASNWLERAEERYQSGSSLGNLLEEIVFDVQESRGGWHVNISLVEPAKNIFYRMGPSSDIQDNGVLDLIDQKTGLRMANNQIVFRDDAVWMTLKDLEIFYMDISGVRRGPFKLPLQYATPESALATLQKKPLENLSTEWLQFGSFIPLRLTSPENIHRLNMGNLVKYRCAIKTVMYGFGDSPDTQHNLPPCNLNAPYRPGSWFGNEYDIISPSTAQSVVVQLTYFDGTTSRIRRFARQTPPDVPRFTATEKDRAAKAARDRRDEETRLNNANNAAKINAWNIKQKEDSDARVLK